MYSTKLSRKYSWLFLSLKLYLNSAPYRLELGCSFTELLSLSYLSKLGLTYMHLFLDLSSLQNNKVWIFPQWSADLWGGSDELGISQHFLIDVLCWGSTSRELQGTDKSVKLDARTKSAFLDELNAGLCYTHMPVICRIPTLNARTANARSQNNMKWRETVANTFSCSVAGKFTFQGAASPKKNFSNPFASKPLPPCSVSQLLSFHYLAIFLMFSFIGGLPPFCLLWRH